MALLDVSELMTDPDFSDTLRLIRRMATVNAYGETTLAESQSIITAVVQQGGTEALTRLPEGARLSDIITVYYRGTLTAEAPGGYADVLVWQGKRYQVYEITESYENFGAGFTKANASQERVSV